MFAVAFVLFLLGNGCVRDARCQNVARNLEGPDYFACDTQKNDGHATSLRKCIATNDSGDKHNINCSDEHGSGLANLTDCAPTTDSTVLYTGCRGTMPRISNSSGPFTIFVSGCFSDPKTHDPNKCGSVNDLNHGPQNCTKVLSEYEKRKPAPTNNGSVVTREDKKEMPKQKQNDGPATRPQRSEVNATEQNRPTSVERNESKEVATPHTSTSSGTVLLTGLHARVFCALQLLRLLK
ncbi:hypothetical protein ERJ75_001211300 [Trypanosoma vivax]|uniref:Uncharacterized protein n=1 Tax=Trypanosoma vivax (strain Y486) TaxID=1055687 RepID=F9WM30_TRYVY|nr:hypothetical protein ERJ75_001211300 [Trypanosoma vivax]CCD18580.1 hypothetical protein, conserved in T. vivax [Trypanosoma vivax Y486]|eukprot:CCD18580.1 hypothetical protein, conserved in T. vivax [Trypanosoma vivax Y486]